MPKLTQLTHLTLVTLLFTSVLGLTAHADTTGSTKVSDATVNVDASDGALTLDAVPSFNFGTISAQDLVTGKTLGLTTTNTSNKLQVTDTRGIGDHHWSLAAKLSQPFTSGTSTLTDASLAIVSEAGTNTGLNNYTQTNDITLTSTDNAVVDQASTHPGTSSYLFTATAASGKPSAKLILPATLTFTSGTYVAEVTWTLTSAQ